jgi:thioredoxin 1
VSTVLDLTAMTFDEELMGSPLPLVVEFWAPWCAPCRAMAPVLESLADDHDGRLRIGRVNADEHPDLGRRYQVGSVPTFLVFSEGELRARMVGARSRPQFLQEIENAVGSLSADQPDRAVSPVR